MANKETLQERAKRLGWSQEFTDGVRVSQEAHQASGRAGMTRKQIETENRAKRLAADSAAQGSRQAARMAGKSARGI